MIDKSKQFIDKFSYRNYIENVDVRRLIENNAIFDELKGRDIPQDAVCFFCGGDFNIGESLRLTNGNYLCESCFRKIQTIRYPEKYQSGYEKYLIQAEARRVAYREFKDSLPKNNTIDNLTRSIEKLSKRIALISIILFITLVIYVLMLFVNNDKWMTFGIGLIIIAGIYGILRTHNQTKTNLEQEKEAILKELTKIWESENPIPTVPILKEFHDPSADLTFADKKIVEVFDYWPGYPPYWNYIRYVVLNRDNDRCQVSGCPSRTPRHIHHKIAISNGGSHKIDNLTTLCVFHHGLQPDMGHEKVWDKIKTLYFSMVKAHYRNGVHVRAHVRRKELASKKELDEIIRYYDIACPTCKITSLELKIDFEKNDIILSCYSCQSRWVFEQKLPEESGPQIAHELLVTKNTGNWMVDFSLMETTRKPAYHKISSAVLAQKRSEQKKVYELQNQHLFCPTCGAPLKMKSGQFGRFWGCTNYFVTGCKYTKKIEI